MFTDSLHNCKSGWLWISTSLNLNLLMHYGDKSGQLWGKTLIYHLLNKYLRKYVKVLLNKKRVNETVNGCLLLLGMAMGLRLDAVHADDADICG